MIRGYRKKSAYLILTVVIITITSTAIYARSSLVKNDAYPVFTSRDPHEFLYTQEKLKIKDLVPEDNWKEHIGFSISPFAQNADHGRNIDGHKTRGGVSVELGDIPNRWNMITLLFGKLPEGKTLGPVLQKAKDVIFPGVATPIDDGRIVDCQQKFGFFSIPIKYRKRGLRFNLQANIIGDFGINISTGVADISQNLTSTADVCDFVDLTVTASPLDSNGKFNCTDVKVKDVQQLLMSELKNIAQEIGINICDFTEISVEDVYFNLYWRHAYGFNQNKKDWSHFLLIPFFELGGSVAAGKRKDSNMAFALPFGNNDHNAIFFTAGVNFDFVETIEFGAEAGITHFFSRDFKNFRIPTSEFQTGIFPFATDVSISPGHNWHFGAKIAARHFLDRLSFSFQYLMVEHQKDNICLKEASPAFMPDILAKTTKFRTKVANIAFNYDFSPHIGVGFLWQAPLSQRNTYRTTTLLFSFYAQF